jgi:UDP-glucose-4-epimerase GalE
VKNYVLVTGAAGYIGGQTMLALQDQGFEVIGIDTRAAPPHLKSASHRFFQEDFGNKHALDIVGEYQPRAIIHCAGTSLVGPSVMNPELYYRNNFVKTKTLLDYLIKSSIKTRVIFSSSAATYGNPVMTPCSEEDPTMPVSPYGESKLMIEMMLRSYAQAYGLDYVTFRYFNACGADPRARHGQEPNATHIIARVLESIRDARTFTLHGDTYPTPDGTCVRDYVHVADIARAHVMAVDRTVPSSVYNLGTSHGASNREIIALAEKVTGRTLDIRVGPIRAGDPDVLTASAALFNNTTTWVPQYNLEEMLRHAWAWYTK